MVLQVKAGGVIDEHWPLYRLRVRMARIELRLASQDDLAALASLAGSVHDPAVQPFAAGWTDAPPVERSRSVVQHHWGTLANWRVDRWSLQLVASVDGRVIGTQSIGARDFAVVREVSTGSWLGTAYQGCGFGTEMRAAVLDLAFGCLGAESAVSGAFTDNPASLGVSRKLGYAADGTIRRQVRGKAVIEHRLRLDRQQWADSLYAGAATIEGLEQCLPLFGA